MYLFYIGIYVKKLKRMVFSLLPVLRNIALIYNPPSSFIFNPIRRHYSGFKVFSESLPIISPFNSIHIHPLSMMPLLLILRTGLSGEAWYGVAFLRLRILSGQGMLRVMCRLPMGLLEQWNMLLN